ncbi:MAG: hypothetical protein ACK401_00595 [Archaeoglobaceae archaeon]
MKFREGLVFGIGITSFLLVIVALLNYWQIFGYLMAVNLSLWLILGASNSRRKEAIIIGVLSLLIWVICLSLIFHYWALFYKKIPDFWIAGMHPGFFVLFPVMWLLIYIATTVSYAILFKKLIEPAFEEFKKKIEEAKGGVKE